MTVDTTKPGEHGGELKPCPFCNSSVTGPRRNYYEHAINDCLFSGFKISASSPRDIAAWNRRDGEQSAVDQWQFRVKDVGSPLWTNTTHADANELRDNPAFELRGLKVVFPLPHENDQAKD